MEINRVWSVAWFDTKRSRVPFFIYVINEYISTNSFRSVYLAIQPFSMNEDHETLHFVSKWPSTSKNVWNNKIIINNRSNQSIWGNPTSNWHNKNPGQQNVTATTATVWPIRPWLNRSTLLITVLLMVGLVRSIPVIYSSRVKQTISAWTHQVIGLRLSVPVIFSLHLGIHLDSACSVALAT